MLSPKNNELLCLENILVRRVPPQLWTLIACVFPVTIIYFNNNNIIQYLCGSLFALYYMLNVLFDLFVYSFDFTNKNMPEYDAIDFSYSVCITNKKVAYIIEQIPPTETKHLNTSPNTIKLKSKLQLEISIYIGGNNYIKHMLYYIYILGITHKNYTQLDYKHFNKTNFICF